METSKLNENEKVRQQTAGPVDNQVQTVTDIVGRTVSEPSDDKRHREELRQLLRETRISSHTDVPPEQYALEVDGRGVFALRDIHAVKAKQKAGKTTTLKVFMAALLVGAMFRVKSLLDKPRIVFFDTEQSRTDTKQILHDVAQLTKLPAADIDDHVVLHSLRRVDHDRLLPLLQVSLEDERPQVVFLDGIVEFVVSFNDESESKQLIKELLKLSEQHQCAIVCVLHTNKGDEDHNMRGHLGTMLAQKAATVLECKKERGSSVITVSCSEARHQEMPEWSITFDADGRIVDADEQRRQLHAQRKAEQQQRRQEAQAEKVKERLDYALLCIRDNGGSMGRSQLTAILMRKFSLERSTVSKFLVSQIEAGTLHEAGKTITATPETALAF